MKYSIRGNMLLSDGSAVVAVLNNYSLWRLITGQSKNHENVDIFFFEVWLNTSTEMLLLFNALKPYVDEYGEFIDWHECNHDEPISTPCIIYETYTRG